MHDGNQHHCYEFFHTSSVFFVHTLRVLLITFGFCPAFRLTLRVLLITFGFCPAFRLALRVLLITFRFCPAFRLALRVLLITFRFCPAFRLTLRVRLSFISARCRQVFQTLRVISHAVKQRLVAGIFYKPQKVGIRNVKRAGVVIRVHANHGIILQIGV